MCFKILRGAEPWESRYVYKTVGRLVKDEAWKGLWYDFIYNIGRGYSINPRAETEDVLLYHARAGFYVYRSVERANSRNHFNAILCLEVKREDFIYQDWSREVATYRRVRVVGEVLVPQRPIITRTLI